MSHESFEDKTNSSDHTHSSDHEHTHSGGHSHSHGHGHHHAHSPEETKAVVNRLSRAIGHLESVKQMVADGRDCSEVLIQLSAVRSALNKAGLVILQSHIEHCIYDAAREGDMTAIEDLNRAIERYLK
jgi:Uncharacterized protein conserved in bacteria